MRHTTRTGLGAFFAVLALATQAWAFGGYSPIVGKPWLSGTSSMTAFAFGHWSLTNGKVTNNLTNLRTWVVPFDSYWQNSNSPGMGSPIVSMMDGQPAANGQRVSTTAQIVVNAPTGARIAVSATVSSANPAMSTYSIEVPFVGNIVSGHVGYINYVIPWKGSIGTISNLKLIF